MSTRISSVFRLLKQVGFALLLLGATSGFAQAPYWVANEGQWEGDFQYKCEVGSTIYYVTPQGMTIDFRSYLPPNSSADLGGLRGASGPLPPFTGEGPGMGVRGHVVQIHYSGLPPFSSAEMGGLRGASGTNKLSHYSSYFMTRDSSKWRSRVGHYENVIVPEVWPGIDVEYRADKQGVETIYHVKPGADPAQIQMEYLGLDQPLRIDANGALILETSLGEVKEQTPYSYQQIGRVQQKITSSVRLLGDNRISFELGEFDHTKELVIDPLLYGTYLGGGGPDSMDDMVRDPFGNLVLCGWTQSPDFPVTPGAYQETLLFDCWAHVTKLSPNADSVIWATYIGRRASLSAVAADARGAVYCAGNFDSDIPPGDWPLTDDALDLIAEGSREGCFARLTPGGDSLEYSSCLGGDGSELLDDLELDQFGSVFITGRVNGTFPITANALFPDTGEFGENGFLVQFNPSSSGLDYSSFIPGGSRGIKLQVTSPGRLWICGNALLPNLPVTGNAFQSIMGNEFDGVTADGFFMLWDLQENALAYCSYFGGGGSDYCRTAFYSTESQLLYITGTTGSSDLPVSLDAYSQSYAGGGDAYIFVLDTTSGQFRATYLGGDEYDPVLPKSFVTEAGVTVVGHTTSPDFPVTTDAMDSVFGANGLPDPNRPDFFIAQLSLDLTTLLYGSFLGGSQGEHCYASILEGDTLWVAGGTNSSDFPTTPDAMQPNRAGGTDGIIEKILLPYGTSVSEYMPPAIPSGLSLNAYPNPFNGTVRVRYDLAQAGDVRLRLHNVHGQVVEQRVLNRQSSGSHELTLDFTNRPSGIYFVSILSQHDHGARKLLHLK